MIIQIRLEGTFPGGPAEVMCQNNLFPLENLLRSKIPLHSVKQAGIAAGPGLLLSTVNFQRDGTRAISGQGAGDPLPPESMTFLMGLLRNHMAPGGRIVLKSYVPPEKLVQLSRLAGVEVDCVLS